MALTEAQKKVLGKIERYENHTEGHDKFWQLEVVEDAHGLLLKATWGKCGRLPASNAVKLYSLEEADKLIREKTAKGYEKV